MLLTKLETQILRQRISQAVTITTSIIVQVLRKHILKHLSFLDFIFKLSSAPACFSALKSPFFFLKIGQNLTRNPMVTSDLAYHVCFKSCASFNNYVSKYAYVILEQLLML